MDYNVTVVPVAEGLICIRGAVNTYALTVDGETVLFDCGPGSAALVPGKVAAVYLTSHDRTGCAGLCDLPGVPVYASEGTAGLLGNAEAVWARNESVRYHMVDFDPQKNIPCSDIKTAGTVGDGDVITRKGWTVKAVATPGFSKHDMSYFLTNGEKTYCVCGKLLYKDGRISELWLLQQGHDAQVCGYHGFMEGLPALRRSLGKIGTADVLLPARGESEEDPAGAVRKFLENSNAYMRLYSEVSALNFYFPGYLGRNTNFTPAFRAKQLPLPDFIRYIPGTTSFAVLSEDGAAFVADCSMPGVLRCLEGLIAAGETGSVDFCWVSHYHHDHVEELNALTEKYGCPVYADESFAGILKEPQNYYLTCLSERAADVTPVRSQTQMKWHEFTLTFYHFPGQTLYHGGLLLEGKDLKVFFSGDSFAPSGFDDYCAWNRNFLREDAGYFRCLDLLKKIKPDMILNQHQSEGFVYNPGQAAYLRSNLLKRREVLKSFVCGNHDEALDPLSVRCMPYGMTVPQGGRAEVKVFFTGHGLRTFTAFAEPALPDGWKVLQTGAAADVRASSGLDRDDAFQSIVIGVPDDAVGRYAVPFHVSENGGYKGLLCHMLIDINEKENSDRK